MNKLLLIEDNLDVRENIAEILELANYSVETAENGKIGVEMAKKICPDLIICDVMMPELDGFGVLHILSKSPETASIPFIFLTAKADRQDFRKGMKLGADDYLTKPFEELELLDAIETRLKKNEILRKNYPKTEEGINNFIGEARGLADLTHLTEDKKSRLFKKKSTIFHEGDYPLGLFFIISGKVKTYMVNEDGKEFITNIFKEGDFMGYAELLEEVPYRETATALEAVNLSMIPKKEFLDLMFTNRDVANKFIKLLANDVFDNEERLLKLAYNSVRKRVAEALIQVHNKYVGENQEEKPFSILREDLASLVGTAKETVIRTLSDFKEEGLIDITSGKITIREVSKLSALRN